MAQRKKLRIPSRREHARQRCARVTAEHARGVALATQPFAWKALDYLRGDYDKAAIRTIVECRTRCGFRIDIIKTATFFRLTRALGGTVSPLSLQLHHWCDC